MAILIWPFILEWIKFKIPNINLRIKDYFYTKTYYKKTLHSSPINVLMLGGDDRKSDYFSATNTNTVKTLIHFKL